MLTYLSHSVNPSIYMYLSIYLSMYLSQSPYLSIKIKLNLDRYCWVDSPGRNELLTPKYLFCHQFILSPVKNLNPSY